MLEYFALLVLGGLSIIPASYQEWHNKRQKRAFMQGHIMQAFKGCSLPYYPAYNTHFYTLQHLCQGGGACYQRVHKPEHFYIDAMDVWGMVENTLVGSYCLLACHHDEVMMIAILIPWMSQIMFKNRLFPYC